MINTIKCLFQIEEYNPPPPHIFFHKLSQKQLFLLMNLTEIQIVQIL
jgi:hypothetical protein